MCIYDKLLLGDEKMEKFKSVYLVLATLIIGVMATFIICDKVLSKKGDKECPICEECRECEVINKEEKNDYQLYLKNLQVSVQSP